MAEEREAAYGTDVPGGRARLPPGPGSGAWGLERPGFRPAMAPDVACRRP